MGMSHLTTYIKQTLYESLSNLELKLQQECQEKIRIPGGRDFLHKISVTTPPSSHPRYGALLEKNHVNPVANLEIPNVLYFLWTTKSMKSFALVFLNTTSW